MTFNTPADGMEEDTATQMLHARRVVSSAVGVLAASMLIALVSYVWDWWDALRQGGTPEPDEWLGLAGVAWLPLAAMVTVRLVRLQRLLAARAREASEAFADAVDTAHGWVWQTDAGLRLTYASDGVELLLGHRAGQLLGRDLLEVIDEAGEAGGATEAAGRREWITRATHQDGSVRHLSSTVAAVRDGSGQVMAYRGFTADITAETIANVAESERRRRYDTARARIEHAMNDPEAMQVVLQPIADLDRHRIAGMEALARFSDQPQRPPDVWFAEAWEVGLGADLELRAVELACRRLPELPPDAYLAVNLSAQTLLDARLPSLLAGLGASARRVVVEVTEHAAIDDYAVLEGALRVVRSMGVRLAVDDAGAGYASMQHILRLRPDIIKLDRSIIADSDADPARFALIGAMASFGASLGMTVVAEGVETSAELAVLTENRISHAQGYYLARPATNANPSLEGVDAPAGV